MSRSDFLGGVVEGFYGRPWSQAERLELLDRLAGWGMNAYFYAPKDDLKHRAIWRERYEPNELTSLQALIDASKERGMKFIYGLSPGLDIRFADAQEVACIEQRFAQLLEVGCRHFGLLFDDLTGELSSADLQEYSSLAAAECSISNQVFTWLRKQSPQSQMLFCPTAYCDRMDRWQLGGGGYLDAIGSLLDPKVDVLWTGPEIVSREIGVESIDRLTSRIGRQPVIWDNLFANDYDQCRLYCGPYAGRTPQLRDHIAGILVNPNNESPINYVPLRTFGQFLQCGEHWNPRTAYLSAVKEWLCRYSTVGSPVALDDLVLLADCHYLPYEEGPEAVRLLRLADELIRQPRDVWGPKYAEFLELNDRVQTVFIRLTELRDRDLFYAWSRRVWDLKEELLLLAEYLAWKSSAGSAGERFHSQSQMEGTYRGGLVAKLRRTFKMDDEHRVREAPPRED
jgi:protein O-GlcNAcase/histone acetyltransferase